MALDIYSTRAQLAALEAMPPEYTFLYDTFCADMGAVEDDKAIYDYRKGTREMAPVVHKGAGGVLMGRTGYETREIGFCTIAPERIVDLHDISGRAFGEEILGAMTPEQRSKKMLAQDLKDMRAAVQRRREWMARQVLLTGKLEVFQYTNEGKEKTASMVADYNFTNKFTPTTAWNASGATIDDDMRTIYDMVYEGMGQMELIVMAPDVANVLLANEDYMKRMDILNAKMGEINTRYRGQGVRFIGYNSDGVEMYSFSGKFLDDDGVYKQIIPAGTLIAGGKGVLKAPHGPITQMEGNGNSARHVTYIKKEVAKRIAPEGADAIKNRLTSRPTIVPFNVDAWVVADVL